MVMGDIVTGCDVLVVGAGPGGYTAAIRASQLGKDVILVDRYDPGGTCVYRGCIPSKTLIHIANLIYDMKNPGNAGIKASVEFDYGKIQQWRFEVVKKLRDGIQHLCKKYGVQVIKGEAYFESSDKARITSQEGTSTFKFENAIIATGSHPDEFPGFPVDGKIVINSNEALGLMKVPENMVVIGAGYIGVELGTMFAKLGAKVSIVQRSSQILTRFDPEVVEVVSQRMKKLGIDIYYNTMARSLSVDNNMAAVMISDDKGKETELRAEKILVAVGVKPNTDKTGLENTKVELSESGFIRVDEKRRTTDPRIYAVGDVAGPPFLAHKAFREGKVAAEVIAGLPSAFDNRAIPLTLFSDPEIAVAGIDEESAKKSGLEIITGKFPFRALGSAMTIDRTDGFVKIVAKKNGEILGIHIVGANASMLISEAAHSIEMAAFLEDLAGTMHPHPTLSEALAEAAEAALGKVIHI
ncbi:MAG: dihydrolipoyl dehydrogenase [Candidatus Methanoperedens sp.]|nr:dihydrolipoyl dehydrogenase [Candidatus Methanoperedens sp.]MCE8429006.1 dihydrolipoyl dehydrogenase [Candidatus Methanoperedens sp.]